jgi:pimeloyl-ACP methyl ester carboxylesterase
MSYYIDYLGTRIHYKKEGIGPVLLLLHGFCEDLSMWEEFSNHFSKKYCVLRPDFPGFGKSTAISNLTVEVLADITDIILAEEQIEKVCMIGHSMGGYVAMAFAEKFEHKLSGLCLFHSHPFEDSSEKKENRKKTLQFIEKWGTETFVKELIPKLFSPEFGRLNKSFVMEFTEKAIKNSPEGIVSATKAMIKRKDRSEILKRLGCPKLLIIGIKDEIVSESINNLQIALSSTIQYKYLKAGHMGMFEAKKESIEIIEEFLNYMNNDSDFNFH